MFQGAAALCARISFLLQLTAIEIKLSAVRRVITPTIVRIATSRETEEGLIGRPGGSTTEDGGGFLVARRFLRAVVPPPSGRVAGVNEMTSSLSLGSMIGYESQLGGRIRAWNWTNQPAGGVT